MNHVITKWRPFEGCDRLPGIMMECTDPGNVKFDLSMPWIAPEDNMIYATDGRIIVRMKRRPGDDEILPFLTHEQARKSGKGRRPSHVNEAFEVGMSTLLGVAELPVVPCPISEPEPCPNHGVECDCPACEGGYFIDEVPGGVPVGGLGHKMASRYVYLLQHFGVRDVRLPFDLMEHPFRFTVGCVEGAVMGMKDPGSR